MNIRCGNQTAVYEIVLLGFSGNESVHVLQFSVLLIFYLITILENGIIIIVVRGSYLVQSPMYVLISHLSCLEVLYITVTVPKVLENIFSLCKTISLPACVIQLHLFLTVASSECLLLGVMAYDRYVAICQPLHYTMIMTIKRCCFLTSVCCLVAFVATTIPIVLIAHLDFCGSNIINHYFCDISPLLKLSCSNVSVVEVLDFIAACVVLLSSLLATTISYANIIRAVLRIPSTGGRRKAFYTCASHLIVVTIFYGTCIFTYARPRAMDSFDLNKIVSAMYSIVTPGINPLIYTLRNKEFKQVLKSAITRGLHF